MERRERNEKRPIQGWPTLRARRWPLQLHIGPDCTRQRRLPWSRVWLRYKSSVPTPSWDWKASSRTLITMCMKFVYLMMDCIYISLRIGLVIVLYIVAFGTLVAWRSATRTRFRTLVAGRSATRMLDGIRRNKQFWSNLNCKFEFFFAGKRTIGAVLDWTAPTNRYYRGGWQYSRPLQISL